MGALSPILRRLPAATRRRAALVLLLLCLLLATAHHAVRAASVPSPAAPPPPSGESGGVPAPDPVPSAAATPDAAAPDPAAQDSPAPGSSVPDAPAVAVLDRSLLAAVFQSALSVLQPRTLEPHSAAQLAGWGLNGFAAIDPALSVTQTGPRLLLADAQAPLFAAPAPAAADAGAWARLAADMAQAAWTASATVRGAGQQAVIQSFFDELFNHLDPYSRYVAPAPAETDRAARSGGTAGAGLALVREKNALLVSAVSANGPAWNAGIAVGSRLVSVDNRPVRSRSAEEVSAALLGDAGSTVVVSVVPPGRTRAVRYALTRAAVPPETVFGFSNGDTVVLRVTGFSSDTALEMSQFLSQATGHDADDDPDDDRGGGSTGGPAAGTPAPHPRLHGLIIDLRGNRGGLLQQAVTSVALLLDHGVAVTTRGRDPQSNHVWAVQGGDLTDGAPIVVLVDGRTASAAEIMAAALSDHRRAVVVGSTTLGKGLVQFVAQMPDGGELFVTWSRVLAPLGWPLQGLGVMPQLCTSLGQSRLDTELQDLSAGSWDMRGAVLDSRAARAPLPAARILELRAPCPAAVGSDDDLDAARILLDTPGAWNAALVPSPPAG